MITEERKPFIPPRWLKPALKSAFIKSRTNRCDWHAMRQMFRSFSERYSALFAQLDETASNVIIRCFMSAKQMTAHVSLVNRAVAGRLTALRANDVTLVLEPALYPDTSNARWADVQEDHALSVHEFLAATASPIESDAVLHHFVFGMLNAREWLAMADFHNAYHIRQALAIMRRIGGRK